MDISNALANSLDITDYHQVTSNGEKKRSPKRSNGDDAKPIVQLNVFPVSIDADNYKNARSTSNPNGDLRPLFAFRQLVDPVPEFGQDYSASTSSTESLYGTISAGATSLPDADFAASVISDSQRQFALETFANMDGTPGSWRPVYSVPEDWSTADDSRFSDLNLDPQKIEQKASFGVITEDTQLNWVLSDNSRKPLNSNTRINSIQMKYLMVGLRRPWYNALLFQTDNWYLSAQKVGFCSSGSPTGNTGVLPLIPTCMLIGKQITVSATWSPEDQAIIDEYHSAGKSLYLGPFSVVGPAADTLYVVGWISELVPLSPKKTKFADGYVKVNNQGAFIAKFTVTWNSNGQQEMRKSGNFPVLSDKKIDIPAAATAITIEIKIMTFPKPFETWSTVKTVELERPATLEYKVSGTTFSPHVEVIE